MTYIDRLFAPFEKLKVFLGSVKTNKSQSMEPISITKDNIKNILALNSFNWDGKTPLVVTFRNTVNSPNGYIFQEDILTNNCDTVILMDETSSIYILSGRSTPHKDYQTKVVAGTMNANYIATGFYQDIWIKGTHYAMNKGYNALIQNAPKVFVIWRSKDMQYGNADDYSQSGVIWDDFHGWAPYSAGCVTVEGQMVPPTGAWKIANEWIYTKHIKSPFFSCAMFNHNDLTDNTIKLRVGSSGILVVKMQDALNRAGFQMLSDGSFGPKTHEIVRQFQKSKLLKDDGIVGSLTMKHLGM